MSVLPTTKEKANGALNTGEVGVSDTRRIQHIGTTESDLKRTNELFENLR